MGYILLLIYRSLNVQRYKVEFQNTTIRSVEFPKFERCLCFFATTEGRAAEEVIKISCRAAYHFEPVSSDYGTEIFVPRRSL